METVAVSTRRSLSAKCRLSKEKEEERETSAERIDRVALTVNRQIEDPKSKTHQPDDDDDDDNAWTISKRKVYDDLHPRHHP